MAFVLPSVTMLTIATQQCKYRKRREENKSGASVLPLRRFCYSTVYADGYSAFGLILPISIIALRNRASSSAVIASTKGFVSLHRFLRKGLLSIM
jgi:hypothetical protein